MKVRLNESPFYLDDEGIQWVKNKIHSLTLEEKLAQLIFYQPQEEEISALDKEITSFGVGGLYLQKDSKAHLYEKCRFLQTHYAVPAFITSKLVTGTKEAIEEGTFIGSPLKISATGKEENAYTLGWVSALEWGAIGGNIIQGPNFSTKEGKEETRYWTKNRGEFLSSFAQGVTENDVIAMGYGLFDEKISLGDWRKQNGAYARRWIKEGGSVLLLDATPFSDYIQMYSEEEKEQQRASYYSTYITEQLLRKQLQFSGVIVANVRPAESADYALAIGSGCDMVYTEEPIETVIAALKEGLHFGVFTEHQLQQSLQRILGVKAMLGLCDNIPFLEVCNKKQELAKVHQAKNQLYQGKISNEAIVLRNDHGGLRQTKGHKIALQPASPKEESLVQSIVQQWEDAQFYVLPLGETTDDFVITVRQDGTTKISDAQCILTCGNPEVPLQNEIEEIIIFDQEEETLLSLLEKIKQNTPFLGTIEEGNE
ncbi:glycoside hydrolase family 3 N-terminal domain-containing protein [Catellicoccus marimammalium]|uniref:Beta-glucosidase-related glycosidase n=1 Tax=Catellicoccus marimammalium M35/04/3 TaxID=1234409 RepID=K8Z9Z7_9ENTE|nr:glycoside hydrolase family 3 N-terminal domain-containing protein [Catellicoccus marimammalium]EKU26887.1 Beta-glucosidase-related glycosidase [Catellicoccus marimammalium M35/04/3]